ncbi:hypothetical protein RJ53_09535, partial [Methanocalculus chunghsingensis]|nr:hypothetical protein [Methanocalculus chunghsingensis]
LDDDPLAEMHLVPEDYGLLTRLVTGIDLPVAFVLEGGYGPSMGRSLAAIFSALKGDPVKIPEIGEVRSSTRRIGELLKRVQM